MTLSEEFDTAIIRQPSEVEVILSRVPSSVRRDRASLVHLEGSMACFLDLFYNMKTATTLGTLQITDFSLRTVYSSPPPKSKDHTQIPYSQCVCCDCQNVSRCCLIIPIKFVDKIQGYDSASLMLVEAFKNT